MLRDKNFQFLHSLFSQLTIVPEVINQNIRKWQRGGVGLSINVLCDYAVKAVNSNW